MGIVASRVALVAVGTEPATVVATPAAELATDRRPPTVERSPVPEKPMTFREAMQAAVELTVPLAVDAPAVRGRPNGEEYVAALHDGQPLICGHEAFRPITVAIANSLSDEHRDEWLRQALAHASDKSYQDEQEALEAIHNLAKDSRLQIEALDRWNQIEQHSYRAGMELRQECLRDPTCVRPPVVEEPRRITLWQGG